MDYDILDPSSLIEEDELLWHYTDINGLLGIFSDVKRGEGDLTFHGSSIYSMNDYKEMEFGISLLALAFEHEFSLGEAYGETVDSYLHETIVKPVLQNISETGFLDVFSVSFSQARDRLSQWRGYADAGYAIGFDYKLLANSISLGQGAAGRRFKFDNVTYFGPNQIQNIWQVQRLNSFKSCVSQIRKGCPIDQVLDYMRWSITQELPFWKSDGFSEEREARFVLWSSSGIKYKSSPLGPRAYTEHTVPLEAVKEVMVGPGRDLDVRFTTTDQFIQEITNGRVHATKSSVTFRT